MSSSGDILGELRALGLEVQANGDRLRLRGPVHVLGPELKERVLKAKSEILCLLAGPAVQTRSRPFNGGLTVRDVLGFSAAALPELPLRITLALDVPGMDGVATVAAHPGCAPGTFGPGEWLAMVAATEADRTGPEDFAGWVRRKWSGFQLAQPEALAPVLDRHPQGWTVGRVLQQLGARLRAVAIDGGE